ncbi:MAG: hypothetical protein ACJA13_000245 [Paraglaciecola sp.]|jgi:hypothetical protein
MTWNFGAYMKTWQILGYLGLLPFMACLYLGTQTTVLGIDAKQAFIAYSAVILSFIAGSLWNAQHQPHHTRQHVISNVFSLIAFISILVGGAFAIAILAVSYLLLFAYENKLVKQCKPGNLKGDYITMRFWLTLSVALLHIGALILWFG